MTQNDLSTAILTHYDAANVAHAIGDHAEGYRRDRAGEALHELLDLMWAASIAEDTDAG
jgi:hypothetical protein